jgi:hypothetical protein
MAEMVYSHWGNTLITKEQAEEEQRQITAFMEWYKKEVRKGKN